MSPREVFEAQKDTIGFHFPHAEPNGGLETQIRGTGRALAIQETSKETFVTELYYFSQVHGRANQRELTLCVHVQKSDCGITVAVTVGFDVSHADSLASSILGFAGIYSQVIAINMTGAN